MRNPFRRGKIKDSCEFDPNTKTFRCISVRITEDGEEPIGEITGGVTASCELSANTVWENEDGVVDRLNKKFISEMRAKCRRMPSTPSDY